MNMYLYIYMYTHTQIYIYIDIYIYIYIHRNRKHRATGPSFEAFWFYTIGQDLAGALYLLQWSTCIQKARTTRACILTHYPEQYVSIYIYMYIYIHINMYVCMYICVYMYMQIRLCMHVLNVLPENVDNSTSHASS